MLQPTSILLLVILPWSAIAADNCGIRGNTATIKEAPYIASVQFSNNYICSGAIINPQFILITSDCVKDHNRTAFTVRVGVADRDSGPVLQACDITFHPHGKKRRYDSRLALLKVCTPLTLSEDVKTIAITKRKPKKDAKASIFGWGSTTRWHHKKKSCWAASSEVLRKDEVQMVDVKTCASKRKLYFKHLSVSDRNICTAKKDKLCSYDKGSPLVIDGKLAAILNIGACGVRPDIYFSLFKYKRWIDDHMKNK
ncbi:trypsin-5-like [Drosophila takahashii]|uniref:trypsin-5-like n=1 Tax=Drosophila takahashii TaxID=29030 RepID=UPI001CF86F3F|nr:trypsin-7-like [Drosophila takahashii]